MNITELVSRGWSYHENESERLAEELENSNIAGMSVADVAQCLKLSNHTIGEHLGDWSRARKFVQSVLAANPSASKLSNIACYRYVADYMDKHHYAAVRAELDALSVSEHVLGTYVVLKSMLAAALVGSGLWDKGFEILNTLNQMASTSELPESTIRSLAITNNNVANDLLAADSQGSTDQKALLDCANAAFQFWKMCGSWVNEERALYLLSLAYACTGDLDRSLAHAKAALRVIQSNGEELVDEAFIRLAAAKAYHGLADLESAYRELEQSDKIAEDWSDDALTEEYQSVRSKLVFI
ncbi:MAG: hypothetical protein OXG24_00725 [Gammaproteobacteria bacterium]|nr:hypothetical protein [Gammaproteobacteria bacterium]